MATNLRCWATASACLATLAAPHASGAPPHRHPLGRPATVAMLRQRIRLGMTEGEVNRALRGLRFQGGQDVINAGPDGWSFETVSYTCADGEVEVGYSPVAYGVKPERATVLALGGAHFFIGDASAIP